MSQLKVFLGGEGSNEIGSRAREPNYQSDDDPGVVQALLGKVSPDGWHVVGALKWSSIVKHRAHGPMKAEEQNVRGLILEARRAQADVVAFVRDADDDDGRRKTVTSAIQSVRKESSNPSIVGGVTVQVLEAWLLALRGETKTESLSKSGIQKKLVASGTPEKNTAAYVELVRQADLSKIPADAASLHAWLGFAREALSPAS